MARIYLAASWKNKHHTSMLTFLSQHNHEVYNFKDPMPGVPGFNWSQMDQEWQTWSPRKFRKVVQTEDRAMAGFAHDLRGMQWANVCVLLLPSGRSVHLEAGWFTGQGKPLIIYIPEGEGPDLMYLLAQHIVVDNTELVDILGRY